jgi:hypothetical protein
MSNAEKTVMFALPNMMTGQLACVAGSAAGRSWDLSAGTFTIGRLEEHDMSLPQEPGISKLHAKIIGQGDRYLITDCESRNGTLLNGELIQRADLYDGDEIRICGCVLRFTQKGGPLRPRPRVTEPIAAPAPAPPPAPAPAPAPAYEPAPSFVAAAEPMPSSSSSPLRTLAAWYGAGLAAALLVGSIASATLLATTPPPAPPTPPTPPVVAAAVVAPPVVAPPIAPPVAPTVVDAGVVPVEQVAAAEAAAAVPELADSPPAPAPAPAPNATETKPAATSSTFSATPEGGRSESVRTKTGGRVRTVEVADGASVSRGAVLVTFETGADADEIATLQDRISSLEAVEGDEAKRDLKTAKARLAALEAGQKAQPITAGIDGRLSGFSVAVGAVLKAGEVVGTIADGEVPTRVRVTVRGVTPKSGQQVTLTLKSGGTATGSVASVSGKNVVVDTGTTAAAAVSSVSF